jgi:HD superfamily phosphohydrolase
MSSLHDIPELASWRRGGGLVRIPPGVDVPLTPRVRRLIDTPAFRRLAQISQLGLVSLVYPAANHSRQEHSLGVFLAAIEYLDRLAANERFSAAVTPADGELLLTSALLHDVGHWPFGHPIEDLHLPDVPKHEQLARRAIVEGEIGEVLHSQWGIEPSNVADLLSGAAGDSRRRILHSILSGPIDVDKIDYLMRDSLHAGVPYGQHFDRRRLIASLCLNERGDGLAITDKGKTAAEMMVFARYVMFSEVYWHHAVRAGTAMLQRAFYSLRDGLDLTRLFAMSERPMIEALITEAADRPERDLVDGLFGPRRRLYKRLAQYSFIEEPATYRRLAGRPFAELVQSSAQIAAALAKVLGRPVADYEVLVDAPPAEREVEFDVEVFYPKEGVYRSLGDVSPVVRTLAREQFDDYVKRVRVFVHPRLADESRRLPDLTKTLADAIGAER